MLFGEEYDLDAVIATVPEERREDLVFLQNGQLEPEKMQQLIRITKEADAKVCLSSNWRLYEDLREHVYAELEAVGIECIGTTPDAGEATHGEGMRPCEIGAWIRFWHEDKQRQRIATFVAVVLGGAAVVGALTYFRLWGYLWKEWFTSVDHKKIGIMYMILGLVMFLRGFADAIMMRIQQAVAFNGSDGYLPAHHYDQIFTAHGVIMIFFVAMPFVTGLMNYIVPLQIGARGRRTRGGAPDHWHSQFIGLHMA